MGQWQATYQKIAEETDWDDRYGLGWLKGLNHEQLYAIKRILHAIGTIWPLGH